MKNCIVLSGQYRTFDDTWPQLKEFIDLNELDVYCHLWGVADEEENNWQFHQVKDRLQPKRILQEPYSDKLETRFNEIESNIRAKNPKGPNQDKLAGNASMNYSRKIAYELVNQEYDNLVYCRYDIGFKQMFKFADVDIIMTPAEESYNLISDIFAIMPFEQAKYYFLYDNYEYLHSNQFEPEFVEWLRKVKQYPEQDIQTHLNQRWCPHMMLMRNIIMNGITYSTQDIPVYLKR